MLAGFTLVNLLGDFFRPEFNASIWWIDASALPGMAEFVLLSMGVLALGVRAFGFPQLAWQAQVLRWTILCLLAVALWNSATFYAVWAKGYINPAMPVPLSLLLAGLLALCLRQYSANNCWANHIATATVCLGLAVCFSLSQMVLFGQTDYRRPADAAVVFGCRAYADGTPSDALADRVLTACDLYTSGTVDMLIFSGGPGDGDIHEVEAMRDFAIAQGVAPSAILLDYQGLNTQHTVNHTAPLIAEQGYSRVLAVSHGYHLPRIKMTYQRAGVEVYTVPAEERYVLTSMPYLMAREVAALWKYYLDPLRA